jgi:DNA-binding NarL/FixJ family response regulator
MRREAGTALPNPGPASPPEQDENGPANAIADRWLRERGHAEVKILIADDHRMMCEGLRAILEKERFEVVGMASNGLEAIALARELRPDIVVVAISMHELNGIDTTRRLIAELPSTKIIALATNADRRFVVAMFRAGATAYLPKSSASDELFQAIRSVVSGHRYISPALADMMVDGSVVQTPSMESVSDDLLTAREREVLQQLAEGRSSKGIARNLGIAVPTVITHRRQIMTKLHLHTTAELTKYAIREGLTSLEC